MERRYDSKVRHNMHAIWLASRQGQRRSDNYAHKSTLQCVFATRCFMDAHRSLPGSICTYEKTCR